MKILTSYIEPDLDGVSSMYAYSELLNKLGEKVYYFIWKMPRIEVRIVCDMFDIKLDPIKNIPNEKNTFVLLDFNGFDQAHESITKESVIEVVDHHGLTKSIHEYTNASRIQIDRVGASATIIAERFKLLGITPSREAAILLYYGIVSNSCNFKANITNSRDIEIADWLKSICSDISEEKIKEIFIKKSIFDDKDLRQEMECERPMITHDKRVLVGQLEICNVLDYLKEKEDKIIKVLNEVKIEKETDYLFLNMVDILNGFSLIYCNLEPTKRLVEKVFNLKFKGNIAKWDCLVQRKEMTKAIRDYEGDLDF